MPTMSAVTEGTGASQAAGIPAHTVVGKGSLIVDKLTIPPINTGSPTLRSADGSSPPSPDLPTGAAASSNASPGRLDGKELLSDMVGFAALPPASAELGGSGPNSGRGDSSSDSSLATSRVPSKTVTPAMSPLTPSTPTASTAAVAAAGTFSAPPRIAESLGEALRTTAPGGSAKDIKTGGAAGMGAVTEPDVVVLEDDTVVVIGGGLSGVFAAREIGKKRKVVLIEKEDEIIPEASSSVAECYKLHLGLHYAGDLATAIQCLERSIKFARENKQFLLGDKLTDPWRRGRHYVMSNSLIKPFEIKRVIAELKKRYEQLIAEDIGNKVFGEVEDFIKILAKTDYPEVASNILFSPPVDPAKPQAPDSVEKVVLGVETAESQIDIVKLKAHLADELRKNPNVTVLTGKQVLRAAHAKDRVGYVLTVRSNGSGGGSGGGPGGDRIQEFHVPVVVNSAWQQIERIEKHLGLVVPHDGLIIRIKVSLVIKLPPSLHNVHTSIFSIGPYVSLTNQGDGTAVLTAEKYTNIGHYNAGAEPKNFNVEGSHDNYRLNLDSGKGKELAANILAEAAKYFPGLAGTNADAKDGAVPLSKVDADAVAKAVAAADPKLATVDVTSTTAAAVAANVSVEPSTRAVLAAGSTTKAADVKVGTAASATSPPPPKPPMGSATAARKIEPGAKVTKIRVGYVKMPVEGQKYDNSSIGDRKSDIHRRLDSGVVRRDTGWNTNSGMKMTYTVGNATELAKIVEEDFLILKKLKVICDLAKANLRTALKLDAGKLDFYSDALLHYTGKRLLTPLISDPVFKKSDNDWAQFLVDELIKIIEVKRKNAEGLNKYSLFKEGKLDAKGVTGVFGPRYEHDQFAPKYKPGKQLQDVNDLSKVPDKDKGDVKRTILTEVFLAPIKAEFAAKLITAEAAKKAASQPRPVAGIATAAAATASSLPPQPPPPPPNGPPLTLS